MTISIGYTEPIYVKSRYNPSIKKVNFRGIFADGVFARWPTKYCEYTAKEIKSGNQDFLSMKESMTAIFRELGSQFAISKLLPNNEKCKIIILGCSDGSAAYSYAIMLRKFLGRQAKNNIKISGVDINPAVVEMANTGYLAVSDTELNRVLSKGFLDSKELGHYLKKSNCPPLFPELLKKYPKLRYLKENPIEPKSIGHGIDWYKVNREELPNTDFKVGSLFDYLKGDKTVRNEVFVGANAIGYTLFHATDKYLKIFEDIKANNQGKNVYVVIGEGEKRGLDPTCRTNIPNDVKSFIASSIDKLGFKKLSELNAAKTISEDAKDKIYKLV